MENSALHSSPDHWPLHAKQWARIGPPLRPSPADLMIVEQWAAAWQKEHVGDFLRVVLLGVTPEIATLHWPVRTSLLALDRCPHMIEAVWPKSGLPANARPRCADWREMPVGDSSFDFVVGDGCLTLFDYPGGYCGLAKEVRRVLERGGCWVLRLFVGPDQPEALDSVWTDLWAGRIGSFHAFKWRLAMALQRSAEYGVELADIWRAWRVNCPDPSTLTQSLGWDPEVVSTIDAYRESPVRYTFPTLREVRTVLRDCYEELACHTPTYELGERCPTMVLRTR